METLLVLLGHLPLARRGVGVPRLRRGVVPGARSPLPAAGRSYWAIGSTVARGEHATSWFLCCVQTLTLLSGSNGSVCAIQRAVRVH